MKARTKLSSGTDRTSLGAHYDEPSIELSGDLWRERTAGGGYPQWA